MAPAWLARLLTLLVWALAIGSITFWALRHVPSEPAQAAPVASTAPAPPPPGDLAAVFGRRAAASAPIPGAAASAPGTVAAAPRSPAERFALVGVVADPRQGGVALISVDGAPARPFEVGARIEEGLRLARVSPQAAVLIPRPPASAITLELPTGRRVERPVASAAANPGANPSAAGVAFRPPGSPTNALPTAPVPGTVPANGADTAAGATPGAGRPPFPFLRRPGPAASAAP